MSGIEETVVFKDTKLEEIKKYFISDAFTEKDRALYLIKKSHPSQKLHFVSHLDCYLKAKEERPLFSLIIQMIIDHLDLWESNICIAFSSSLSAIMTQLMVTTAENNNKQLDKEDNELCVMCLSHFIKAITTMEKTVSDGYLVSFSKCIKTISDNSSFRLKANEEINQLVLPLAKVGQSPFNHKYALFLITCLVRISEYQEGLFECFSSLIHEKQKEIKYEIAFDLRFILKEIDIGCVKSTYYPVIKSYLNESDIILREIILETLFINTALCDISLKSVMHSALKEIYSCDDSYALSTDIQHLNNIFISMTRCCYANIIDGKAKELEGIDYHSLIVLYLERFLLNNERTNRDSNSSSDSFEGNSRERGDMYNIDYLFQEFDMISKALIHFDNAVFLTSCFTSLLRQVNSKNEAEFYSNIAHVLKYISKEVMTYKKLARIFGFLSNEDKGENNKEASIDFNSNHFDYFHFNQVIDIMRDNANEQFFLRLFEPPDHLTKVIDSLSPRWRKQRFIINSFSSSVLFYIASNYKVFSYAKWFKELFDISQRYCLLDNANYSLLVDCARLLARLCKYTICRDPVIAFVHADLLSNQSFYKRRLICSFIEECYQVLSLELFDEMQLGDLLIKALEDQTAIMKCWALRFVLRNHFSGSWVEQFKERVNELCNSSITDDELKKAIGIFKNSTEAKKDTITSEDNSKRREEEGMITEIEKSAREQDALNKKTNSINQNSHKKPTSYKKISIISNNPNSYTVRNNKGSSQKLKQSLLIKTSGELVTINSISMLASSQKPKTRSSLPLNYNLIKDKIGKPYVIENPHAKLKTTGSKPHS